MNLSKRLQELSPSTTLTISAKAKELKSQGKDIIDLSVGEPDFNTPRHIIEAAKEAIDLGYTKYTASGGVGELKDAIIDKFERENNLRYQPNQVVVTTGAKHALYSLFQAILDPEDEVIIPAPYWVSYVEQVKLAGGRPVIVDGVESNQYKITPSQLEKAITERTKVLLINSPSNPTGMVYTEDELRMLGEVCVNSDILVVADEIYEHLIYGEEKHVSIASLGSEIYDRAIIVNGVSKTYAMTGWRLGFAAGPAKIIKAITDLVSHSTSNATSISQYAAIAALNGSREPIEEMKKAFKNRRDFVINRINEIKGFQCFLPTGAFYAYVNIGQIMDNNTKYTTTDMWVEALLEEELVSIIPGSAFGSHDHVRISYAASMEQLEKGLDRIERFVRKNI